MITLRYWSAPLLGNLVHGRVDWSNRKRLRTDQLECLFLPWDNHHLRAASAALLYAFPLAALGFRVGFGLGASLTGSV